MSEVIVINPIQNNEIKKKRVAAYARVSSNSADQKNSFTAQVEFYTSLIGNNPEYEMVDIYAEACDIIEPTQENRLKQGFQRVGSIFTIISWG